MKNLFDIREKVVFITGGSSGLGAHFAQMYAEQGAKVAIVARRENRLIEVANAIHAAGGTCFYTICDITDENSVKAAVKATMEEFGRIDILVNNAGVAVAGKAEDLALSEWKKVIDANLTGVYLVSREVGNIMIEQKYGKIINLASIHSSHAINANVHPITSYAASKGGVKMLTKGLAAEWAQYNITVNAIGPAYFISEMTAAAANNEGFLQFVGMRCPMGRMGREGELDGAMLYFSSDASSYTTGQLLEVDGGWTAI